MNTNQNSQMEGLIVEDIIIGNGQEVKPNDNILVHYVGTLPAHGDQVFDSSVARGEPFGFTIGVGAVIPGWEIGILGDNQSPEGQIPPMKVGGRRKLTVPAMLAYGERGIGPIPPNSTLVFDVELIQIN